MEAGALHTPKILQLSGIRSSSILDRLGTNQIINLPGVGENFQDHPAQYLAVVVTNLTDPTQNPAYRDQSFYPKFNTVPRFNPRSSAIDQTEILFRRIVIFSIYRTPTWIPSAS
jgi:choline dehydrogenase-like flavoprotein